MGSSACATVALLLALLLAGQPGTASAARTVLEVGTHADFKKMLSHHKTKTGLPIVVDFFSHSCGPCQMIKPVYKRLAEEFKGRVIFATVDVNANQETSQSEQVRSMPTFKFYLNGKVYKQFSGADERQLRAVTAEIARKAAQANIEVTPEALAQYYAEFDASKVGKVEEILAKYKHADLVKNLKAKYGKAPATQKRKKYDPKLEKAKKEEALKGASLRKASVEELEQELQRRNGDKDEDELEEMMVGPKAYKAKPNKLVVIGAGPAGLAAAVYAARAGLKPVVVAPPMGGQLMGKGVDVENFPGVEGSTGPSIVKQMRRQAFAFETRFEFDMATSIDLSKRPFAVSHAHGMLAGMLAGWLARSRALCLHGHPRPCAAAAATAAAVAA
jgi:thioredoxin-like negative regulator of GroEL